jgi:hypothetical protein
MVLASEPQAVLDAAFAGINRVAEVIASLSDEDWPKAFAAAERSYAKTARDLGYSQGQAEGWATALLVRLRSEVELLTQGIGNAA